MLVPMLPLTLTRMPTLTAPFPAQVRAIQSRAGLVAALMKSATCGCLDALWSEVAPDGAAGAKVAAGRVQAKRSVGERGPAPPRRLACRSGGSLPEGRASNSRFRPSCA